MAQLIEYSPSVYESRIPPPAFQMWKRVYREFKAILSYIQSWGLAGTTSDCFMKTEKKKEQVCWLTSVISAFGRLRQGDCKTFETSFGYIVKSRPAWATETNPISEKKETHPPTERQ